jgi:hypothetical protein
MVETNDDPSRKHPVATYPKGNQLTRAPCHPPRFKQGKEHKFQANILKSRKIQYNIFKCFKYQSDTYNDTWTHYLMEQDLLPSRTRPGVMDVVVGDV